MENDATFQYVKLFVENVSILPLILLALVVYVFRNPTVLAKIPEHVSKMRFGTLEVELREIRETVKETKQQVSEIENELERDRVAFRDLLDFDPHAPVADLAAARATLKAVAPRFDDLSEVRAGLAEGAGAEHVYAAAEIARARRDPELFDDLVACIDRLARQHDLGGIRLHTVWTLTSALHRTLVAEVKHAATPRLSREQLAAARDALDRLQRNPRVLMDRIDDPMKGIRGPAKWAADWIDKALEKLDRAPGPRG